MIENEIVQPQQINLYSDLPKKRPLFLKILCILSFVGVAGGAWFFWGMLANVVYNSNETGVDGNSIPFIERFSIPTYDKKFWEMVSSSVCLVSQFISLIGVILMWKFKKRGFYIYVFSELISLAILTASTLYYLGGFMSDLDEYWISIVLFLDISFVIMYAVNYKHLK